MRVRYTPQALADLETICTYIAERSPKGARNVKARIRKSVAALGQFPKVARELEQRPGVYCTPVVRYPYLIFFRLRDGVVEIVHIL
jgi:toxin ParE1/3/4